MWRRMTVQRQQRYERVGHMLEFSGLQTSRGSELRDSLLWPLTAEQKSDSHLRGDEKKTLSRPDSTTSGNNTYILSSPVDIPNTGRSEPLLLKLDERQKLARERREEREKQNDISGSIR
ncbi:ensconsin isoform X3 [Tachysurus ichikawai]